MLDFKQLLTFLKHAVLLLVTTQKMIMTLLSDNKRCLYISTKHGILQQKMIYLVGIFRFPNCYSLKSVNYSK